MVFWQGGLPKALRELHQSILALAGIEIRFKRRRCGSQERARLVYVGQHDRSIAGMVARSRIKLLVTGFVLLIHNHQPQAIKRQKQGGAHANHKGETAVQHPIPDLHPLVVRVLGMVDAHARPEDLLQPPHQLCSERNFRK